MGGDVEPRKCCPFRLLSAGTDFSGLWMKLCLEEGK